ncbi:MAG: GHKL domain-containing protein [Defluviitaleaceae bacterium]|nr:GHKL domain-containing protein [Defluviitaleaceae bacterium]
MLYFWLIYSVLFIIVSLYYIALQKYSLHEISVSAIVIYLIAAFVIAVTGDSQVLYMYTDMIGNLFVVCCLLILVYFKTKNVLQSIFFSTFAVLIAMIINTLVAMPITILHDTIHVYIRESFFQIAVAMNSTLILCFFISRHIGKRLRSNYFRLSNIARKQFIKYGCLLSVLTYLLSQVNILAYRVVDDRVLLSNINIILITVVFFVAVIMMAAYSRSQQKQMESEFRNESLKALESHNRNLMQAYDEMSRFRHDHLSLLHSFVGFAEGGNQTDFKSHLMKTLTYAEETLKNLDTSMAKLKFIHIPEICGLLSVKLAHAIAQDINVKIDISEVVDDIPVNKIDLCRMLGIILDNAIEELLNYEIKLLKFGVILNPDDIMIICSNSCKTPPDVTEIFSKGYSSKGLGRGMGLYSLKEISKNSGNVIVTTRIKRDEFVLVLTIRKV